MSAIDTIEIDGGEYFSFIPDKLEVDSTVAMFGFTITDQRGFGTDADGGAVAVSVHVMMFREERDALVEAMLAHQAAEQAREN